MHLDVSRHFFPKEFIENILTTSARYKFQHFHWHLTDDIRDGELKSKNILCLPRLAHREMVDDRCLTVIRNIDSIRYGGLLQQADGARDQSLTRKRDTSPSFPKLKCLPIVWQLLLRIRNSLALVVPSKQEKAVGWL
jgi:hypothetical protein